MNLNSMCSNVQTEVWLNICVGEGSKVLRMKQYLPRQKWTRNETLIFFKIVPLAFRLSIPVNVTFAEAPLNHLFWNCVKQHCQVFFFFMCSISSKPAQEIPSQFRTQDKLNWRRWLGKKMHFHNPVFHKALLFKNYWHWLIEKKLKFQIFFWLLYHLL